jgi:outer membrane protein TolC
VPGEILERRPDVREAEERLAVAIAQLKVDRRSLFPKFTLKPGVGLTRTEQESFVGFDATSGDPLFGPVTSLIADWSIGLGVNVPVLDRPRLLAVARASDARAEQAVIAYEAAVQRAYGEADSALLQLAADRNRMEYLQAAEADAQAAFEAARVRYQAGLDDQISLLSAEQAWRAARQQTTAARTQAMRRAVQVFKALGGGWSPGDDFRV